MSLERMVTELRALLAAEVPSRTTQTSSLLAHDAAGNPDNDEPGIGYPLTHAMHRYIGHWERWGQSRRAMLSIMEVSDWCHARHTSHSIPGSHRSLCAQLLYEVAYLGQSPREVSWIHAIPTKEVRSMLTAALRHAEEWRGRKNQRLDVDFDAPGPYPNEPLRRTA
jgi:hypothetical protein